MENKIKKILCNLGICNEQSIVPFWPKVRDRDDVSVMKCQKSGVLFLSRSDHMDYSHYESKQNFKYWGGAKDRNTAILSGHEDNQRRLEQFKSIISNRKWIDIGTGVGGILDVLSPFASETLAVEPQKAARESLIDIGYNVCASVNDIPDDDIEVVTLFHVFEHLTDPLRTLKILKNKMSPGPESKIVIEVPHAKDFLISFLDLNEFKNFSFWSEHLILHTRDSLRVFLENAGFTEISIVGFQRYPLANHLYWLAKGEPGGHNIWNHLRTLNLDTAYADMLAKIDCTDTLIAVATNNGQG